MILHTQQIVRDSPGTNAEQGRWLTPPEAQEEASGRIPLNLVERLDLHHQRGKRLKQGGRILGQACLYSHRLHQSAPNLKRSFEPSLSP